MQPLAKVNQKDTRLSEQFNLVFGGSEMCKAFSELNDPVDQLERFSEQQTMRDAGDEEAQMMDIDYVEALEYGMPPACGLGYSERVFWSLEGITAREGVPFPQLRNEIDETTKTIYPELADLLTPAKTEKKSVQAKDLPVSAATQGTQKLYLYDFSQTEFKASIVVAEPLDEDMWRVQLDVTAFYPGGGGQACDVGDISWQTGSLSLSKVAKDADGHIYHEGTLAGDAPKEGMAVSGQIDEQRRLLNSRLHCAGHLLDKALEKVGLDWKPGKGAHFPEMSYVEYSTDSFDAQAADEIAANIQVAIRELVSAGGEIRNIEVPSNEARDLSNYIPEAILSGYQRVNLAVYPEDFYICCGGTHVQDVSQVGEVSVTKVKKKGANIRVSYTIS